MDCEYIPSITIDWVVQKTGIKDSDICSTESLILTGTLTQKIVSLGNALVSFAHLRHLDLSRNYISSLDGLQYCQVLEALNLYYNNVRSTSEVQKLRYNPKLRQVDLRLNPVASKSSEYRLYLIHALPNLQLLDNTEMTDKDRILAVQYHATDEAYKMGLNPDPDLRLLQNKPDEVLLERGITPQHKHQYDSLTCSYDKFIKELRPPNHVLQPKADVYDAYATKGVFTPNPKMLSTSDSTTSNFTDDTENIPIKSSDKDLYRENKLLRKKCNRYIQLMEKMKETSISKESYIKLQDDFYRSMKKCEELEGMYSTCREELAALKQHVQTLTSENSALKQEIKIKEEVHAVDDELKNVCRDLQDTMEKDRNRHSQQIGDFTKKYEDMAKTFTTTLNQMEKKYDKDKLILQKKHEAEAVQFHKNFKELQKLIEVSKSISKLKNDT